MTLKLTQRQSILFEYIKSRHGDQKRKYSGAPYWTHLLSVAGIVCDYSSGSMEIEIALCHDLIEDTTATYEELENKLHSLGYAEWEITNIVKGVEDLTDVYVHADYPQLNRRQRKLLEAERLLNTLAHSQTVKYADIIDNTTSIVSEDPGFARVYLGEITRYIYKLDKGNAELYRRCLDCIELAMKK